MIIKISRTPDAIARLNMINFERDMKQHFDIEKAIMDNIIVKENKTLSTDKDVLKYIYLSNDWGNLLMLKKETKVDEIDFKMHKCYITGITVYNPDKVEVKKSEMLFKDLYIDKVDYVIVNTFNPKIEKHIEHMIWYMLSQGSINYVDFDWKIVVDLE